MNDPAPSSVPPPDAPGRVAHEEKTRQKGGGPDDDVTAPDFKRPKGLFQDQVEKVERTMHGPLMCAPSKGDTIPPPSEDIAVRFGEPSMVLAAVKLLDEQAFEFLEEEGEEAREWLTGLNSTVKECVLKGAPEAMRKRLSSAVDEFLAPEGLGAFRTFVQEVSKMGMEQSHQK